jgi:hypothetical protein
MPLSGSINLGFMATLDGKDLGLAARRTYGADPAWVDSEGS